MNKYIAQQMREHRNYANSFKKAPSNSNEQFHPKTGKIITWMESQSLIDRDAEKRANNIIKKMNDKIQSKNKSHHTPKVGDKLLLTNKDDSVHLLTIKERGVFVRKGEYPSSSNYSILEDSNGNIITNKDGSEAWFYDEFLTDENFVNNL